MHVIIRAAAVAAIALMPAVAGAQAKIAFVRSQDVLDAAPGRAAVESQLTKELQGFEATAKRMQDSLQAMVESYQKAAATLTQAQREAREKAIRERQQEYTQRDQQMREQAQQRQAELVQPIIAKVREILDDIRATEGYTMILDLEAQGQAVLSYDKNLDITDRVINRLKSMPPATATSQAQPARPAGAPVAVPAGATRPKP
jgi:outer membrane protein